jgi:hypothetical protein
MEETNMISYNEALARAKAAKPNWNEEYIAKAIITWADADYFYELEVENEGYDDDEFTDWVEAHAEELAKKAAEDENTTFEEVSDIDYETDCYNDDEDFEDYYDEACELEWECRTGR